MSRWFLPFVGMLAVSNAIMNYAWYGHLKHFKNDTRTWLVVLVAWGIAFFEYCFAVPANRMAAPHLSLFQLKIIQEVITLLVFVGFAWVFGKETLRWNHGVAFGCLLVAVFFAFRW